MIRSVLVSVPRIPVAIGSSCLPFGKLIADPLLYALPERGNRNLGHLHTEGIQKQDDRFYLELQLIACYVVWIIAPHEELPSRHKGPALGASVFLAPANDARSQIVAVFSQLTPRPVSVAVQVPTTLYTSTSFADELPAVYTLISPTTAGS
jgi:hypothetical protein